MQVFVDDSAAPPSTHAWSSRKVLNTLAPNVQGHQQTASKSSSAESAKAAAVSDELFENRALLHRVLREKQQLLARCTQQEVALRAAAAHESALTAELTEMESTIAGLAAAAAAIDLAMAAAPAKQDEAPAPAALHPPSPLPMETLAAAAHAAAAHAVAAREAQAQEAIERQAREAREAQAQEAIERQAREAVERALLARSRECEELELRARFKEAQLEHQLAQVAMREKELSSYCWQAAQQPQPMVSPAAMSPSLSEPVDMIAAAIATAAAAFLSAAPPPPSDAMPAAAAAPPP